MIVGGPPCQAYSLIGRARDKDGMKNDSRNYLYKEYAKFLKEYNPKVFVFENEKYIRVKTYVTDDIVPCQTIPHIAVDLKEVFVKH